MELFLVVRRGRSTWTCWAFAFDIPHPLLNLDEKPVQTLAVTTGRSAQKVTQVEMICQTTLSICASRQIKALCPISCMGLINQSKPNTSLSVILIADSLQDFS